MLFKEKFKFDIEKFPFRIQISKPHIIREGCVHGVICLPPEGSDRFHCRLILTGLDSWYYLVKISYFSEEEGNYLFNKLQNLNVPLVVEYRGGSAVVREFNVKYYCVWDEDPSARNTGQLEINLAIPKLTYETNAASEGYLINRYPDLVEENEKHESEQYLLSLKRLKSKTEYLTRDNV